jgi:hypothetical protein
MGLGDLLIVFEVSWYFPFFPGGFGYVRLRKLSESGCPERGGGRLPRKKSSHLVQVFFVVDPARPATPTCPPHAGAWAEAVSEAKIGTAGANFQKTLSLRLSKSPRAAFWQECRAPVKRNKKNLAKKAEKHRLLIGRSREVMKEAKVLIWICYKFRLKQKAATREHGGFFPVVEIGLSRRRSPRRPTADDLGPRQRPRVQESAIRLQRFAAQVYLLPAARSLSADQQ